MGLVFIILFLSIERHAKDPIVDLNLFKNRVFSRSMWALFLLFMAAPPFLLIMPFYLIQAREMSPSRAGMLMAVTSVITMVVGMAITGTLFSARQVIHQAALHREGISEVLAAVQSIPLAFHNVLTLAIIVQCIVFLLSFVREP